MAKQTKKCNPCRGMEAIVRQIVAGFATRRTLAGAQQFPIVARFSVAGADRASLASGSWASLLLPRKSDRSERSASTAARTASSRLARTSNTPVGDVGRLPSCRPCRVPQDDATGQSPGLSLPVWPAPCSLAELARSLPLLSARRPGRGGSGRDAPRGNDTLGVPPDRRGCTRVLAYLRSDWQGGAAGGHA